MQTNQPYSKLYIAVLDDFPDYMTPTLVSHTMLGAHLKFETDPIYKEWIQNSFRKAVVSVPRKVFDKIAALNPVYLGHENKTLDGIKSCAIPLPVMSNNVPNVLKFAKLWAPKVSSTSTS